MSLSREYTFWGSMSPLGGLSGAGLLVMASARLSWAIVIAGSLLWVYALTSLTFTFMCTTINKKFFPSSGTMLIFICLASFFGSVYLLLFWLLCPFAALELFFLLLLVPLFCAGSSMFEGLIYPPEHTHLDIFDQVSDAASQAAIFSGLIIAFSIIREPLAYCSLSFPGSSQGMIKIVNFVSGSFFPIGIFTTSAGALLLLGYFVCLYQYFKNKSSGRF
jgi:hypothetical protein